MWRPRVELPAEVWALVLALLPLADRLALRVTCRYYRDLVDDSGLFRSRSVELSRAADEYEGRFWSALRRWRVSSARLCAPRGWTRVGLELPGLTALTVHYRYFTELMDLRTFSGLRRLYLKLHTVRLEALFAVLPQRLTHLRVCQLFDFNTNSLPAEIPPGSPFGKLRSFAFHCMFDSHPVEVLHFFLSALPQLQHISLRFYTDSNYEGLVSDLPPLHNCRLSSLELLQCKTEKLPLDLMNMLSTLSFLRSLAVFCTYGGDGDDELQKLSAWLTALPALTSLLVECGDVGGFAESIPSSVTRLILMPYYIYSEDLTALSSRLPNLRHLHLEPYRPCRSSDVALVPELFPKLKTLRLFHEQVPEDVFLSMALLTELEVLETQDAEPPPAALVSRFRELTNNRVRVYKSPERPWSWSCRCSPDIPTDYWAQV